VGGSPAPADSDQPVGWRELIAQQRGILVEVNLRHNLFRKFRNNK
jgi:hypothetical protein